MNLQNNHMSSTINFYGKLRDKKSSAILSEILEFINSSFKEICENIEDLNRISIAFQDFVMKTTMNFAKCWEIEFPNNKESYVEIVEGIEGLMTKALYLQILEQLGEDSKLEKQIEKYSFITTKHLGLDFSIEEFELANHIRTFGEIYQYRSPKEKITCLVNLCNYLNYQFALNDKSSLVKFIIYVIIKCNVPNLKSHLRFCALFRHKTVITSDEDYFLCLAFHGFEIIEKMNYNLLKISKKEYYEYCDEYEKKELLNSVKMVNGHFVQDKSLDENLLNLLNKSLSECVEEGEIASNPGSLMLMRGNNEPICTNDGILNLPCEELYKEYYSQSFNEMNLEKIERLRNDFKIILKLLESLKNEYKSSGESSCDLTNTGINLNLNPSPTPNQKLLNSQRSQSMPVKANNLSFQNTKLLDI